MAPLVAMAESESEVQKVVAHAIPTASSVLLMPCSATIHERRRK